MTMLLKIENTFTGTKTINVPEFYDGTFGMLPIQD